ncbi:MAG: Hsp70 family protein, partial [Lachnospiraceae bacterium]|nr:Hsp70 family protein [Lachnospiraceae bacterium]
GQTEDVPLLQPVIEWGSNILNDSLYLGAKNGAVSMIIPTGAVLPYTSERMTGFQIEPGQSQIAIPIKSQNLDGSYRTITRGNIRFEQHYPNGAFVAFTVQMGKSKIITMNAWTSKDEQGLEKIEEGFIELAVGEERESALKTKFVAPRGTNLKPKEEINTLLQLFHNLEKCKTRQEKSNISKRIKANVGSICSAGNKEDFAEPVLEKLEELREEEARMRFFTIARRLGTNWNTAEKRKLARICISQLSMELNGMSDNGPKVSTNNQAIYALGICGEGADWKRLSILHESGRYLQACLYAHARSKTDLDWLLTEFRKDIRQAEQGRSSNLQFSAYAVGIALRREEGAPVLDEKIEEDVVKTLIAVIQRGNMSKEELICSLLALGWICDQRREESRLSVPLLKEVFETVRDIGYYSKSLLEQDTRKVQKVVEKLIRGESLDEEEEQFLLTKLEG